MGHVFDCGDGSCIGWHQRHLVRVIYHLLSVLSGCLTYGAFVAAVVALVLLTARAVDFSLIFFFVFSGATIKGLENEKQNRLPPLRQ